MNKLRNTIVATIILGLASTLAQAQEVDTDQGSTHRYVQQLKHGFFDLRPGVLPNGSCGVDVINAGTEPIASVSRTPNSNFQGLADYNFEPHYLFSDAVMNVSDRRLRIHYLDEGPRDASETILLMHGEPTWSYTFRHMIPILTNAGYRVIVPDLVGFGRSDKPAQRTDYSYERQVVWMADFVRQLGLTNVTLFGHDWGGLIGLRLVASSPERFARVVLAAGFLPHGDGPPSLFQFVFAAILSQEIESWGETVQSGTQKNLTQAEIDAYDAPFPSERYKPGSRIMPQSPPTLLRCPSALSNLEALRRLERFEKPFLTLWGSEDPVLPVDTVPVWFQENVPGAQGQPHHVVAGAKHFVQEEAPEESALVLMNFILDNPVE